MKQRLMELYFTDGGDLTDREVLVKAASECGLDADEVRAALATEADVAEITKAAEAAQKSGIEGVPFLSSAASTRCRARNRRASRRRDRTGRARACGG